MFIRKTKTSTSAAGEAYHTFRLVASERVGDKVRQKTLLNLGRNFSLTRDKWPQLCARIEGILSGQLALVAPSAEIEELAQRYAAQLVTSRPPVEPREAEVVYAEVDVASLELTRPRGIGIEHVGLEALKKLEISETLAAAGFNGIEVAMAMGSILGRMADPGSELATWRWLTERSGLGELLEVDYASMSLMRLYRVSDLLVHNRQVIEASLFSRIGALFSLATTVTLYDLTNTFFEGEMRANGKARRGHSKEKRSDCPLVTLGLVLDGSGFIRRSRMFAGSVAEPTTLHTMLEGLETPEGAMVIMDRGIATQANIDWLIEHRYRYLVVSRERVRQFDEEQAVEVSSAASDQTIQIQRVVSEDDSEVRLYCHSTQREEKEGAINARLIKRFEDGLQKIAASLSKPRGTKQRDKVLKRIGRLQEKSRGISQHYRIDLVPDEAGATVTGLSWEQMPQNGTRMTHPGVYCLRTNELHWDEATLWRTYTMLTDLEAVFRSLKSELGMRPVYHHKEERAEGHLFITVLAYQAVQVIRRKLKNNGINDSWTTLRRIFSGQQRVTATFKQKDGQTLHVRKTTVAEPKLQKLYNVLGISPSPVGIRKMVS